MARSQSSLSRGLIGIITITLALGLIAYLHNTAKTNASQRLSIASALAKPGQASPAGKPAQGSTAQGSTLEASTERGAGQASAGRATGAEAGLTDISIAPAPINRPPTVTLLPTTKPATQPAVAVNSASAGLSASPLVDGKARLDTGDLLAGRRILSAALVSDALSDADADQAKAMLNTANATLVFSARRFADDEFGGTYSVQPGELLQKIAAQHDVTWQYLCRVNGLADPKKLRAGATIKVARGPFTAIVDKRRFTMEIWVGGDPYTAGACYVTRFGVGLGKDDSTPTGTWQIQTGNKIKNPTYYSPRGEGVIEAGDPKNPLGQYWMGLVGIDGHAVGKSSYGIHGTIDPDSIGKQASMGCIRMKNEDVAQVFELLIEGKSTVIVRD